MSFLEGVFGSSKTEPHSERNPRSSDELLGVQSERPDEEGIDEYDQEAYNNGTDVDTAEPAGRHETAKWPEHGLSETIQNQGHRIQGRDIDPGENGPDDDHPEVKHQDKMEDPGQGGQKISQKDHLNFPGEGYLCTW
jgi:hypothetical protein